MSQIRCGLIGCGGIGGTHTRCLAEVDGIAMIAFCDVVGSSSRSLCDEVDGDFATTDADKIFSDDSLDAVYIATHHNTHADLAIRAAEAGKHIFLEKPLALSEPECEAVVDAVEKAGVTFMLGFKMRYYSLVQEAHEFIPRPLITVGQMMDNRWPDDNWAQDPIRGGGNVISQGCHTMDLVAYLSGSQPKRVYAEGGAMIHDNPNVIDQAVATILFENGSVASVIQGDAGCPPHNSKFHFQMFDWPKTCELYDRFTHATFNDGTEVEERTRLDEEGFLLENIDFANALKQGTPAPSDHFDGLRATMMVLKVFDAIRTGQPQTL